MISRPLTVLFAALEALLVLGVGVAVPLVPLSILWAVQFGFGLDWVAFWRAAVDVWLVGHGVEVTFTLDPTLAASLALPGAELPFVVSVAALGIALMTTLLGVRAGRRIAETRYATLGAIVSVVVFALGALALAATAVHPLARPSLVQSSILPVLFYAVGLLLGMRTTGRDLGRAPRRMPWDAIPDPVASILAIALRGGAAAVALLGLFASIVTAIVIVASYARIITLYESLHTELLGGVVVTLAQLLFVPTLVVWTASWLVGPGFALGSGSMVSPLGTQLGPLPAIPVLGALPAGESSLGFVGLIAPLAAGFLVGAILGPMIRRRVEGPLVLVSAAAMGVVGGIILGVLAWFSSGGLGPGRLADVGPNPWAVGLWAALELAFAATAGVVVADRRPRGQR